MSRSSDEILRDLKFHEGMVDALRDELRAVLDEGCNTEDPASLAARTLAEAIRDGMSVPSSTRRPLPTTGL